MFVKEKANTLAGRKVEVVAADTGGNPAGAKTKAQELIERDKVNVILGPLAAFELLAITDYVRDNATPLISMAAAEDVTQRRANPFLIRTSGSSAQCLHVGDYAAKDLKYKRAATIAEDTAYGYEQLAGFQRVFEENGGKVVKKLWPPLVTPDYTPYIAQIANVDCVVGGFAGSNPVKFMRAYADLGWKARIPILAGWTAMDDALLRSLNGDEAIGVISSHWYSADSDFDANKRFVAGMRSDYGVLPGGYSAGMYIAAQCVEAAMAKLGDAADNRKALADALHQVTLTDTPRGPVRFDHSGNVVGDVYIRKCERKNGALVNTIIKRYPDVSQFWTYDEKEFLAAPVYARDYPPARYLE